MQCTTSPSSARLDKTLGRPLISYGASLILMCSVSLFGCDPDRPDEINNEGNSSSPSVELGQLVGELRLPQGEDCHTFTAVDHESGDQLFSLEIDQARAHNHRYSFQQSLPSGDYALRGLLDCVEGAESGG